MTSIQELEKRARILRARIVETSHTASIPHLGSCLSCVDILVALYFSILRIDPQIPQSLDRDRFILSKGHGAPALFQVLAMRGFYPESLLDNYGEDGGIFAEHPPVPGYLPGIEAATGSLGHGLPLALGMAMAASIQQQSYHVYAVLSDGECNEGSVWEAAMLAASQKVNNLCVIVDFNKWQATGRSQEIMALDPLVDKWRAFGWNTTEIDGHNLPSLCESLKSFPAVNQKPTAIIAHTIKGKGISFMEDDNNWHYRIPTAEEVSLAKQELSIEEVGVL
ncbi:MAG: transketolase [Legionellaceae bacterium]|nr:transketolase [Legionellaceae bacterium]MBP9774360.1 transketolase [Legionellaceae bacterium]